MLANVFFRGWLIVTLVSANTYQIANGHMIGAFMIGGGISLVWWHNAHSASLRPSMAPIYALGAAIGTVTGMFLAGRFYE